MLKRQLYTCLRNHTQRDCKHIGKRFSHSVLGIDLGTTNSAVAILHGDEAKIIENEEGKRTTPSIVAFTEKNGESNVIVGEAAKRQALINPQNTFFATKRLIGRRFEEDEIQQDLKNIPYKIIQHENGDAWIETAHKRKMSPSQISGLILQKMKSIAESGLDSTFDHAVVTVPAYFNDSQRQATKDSGKIIGLNVLRVVNEPTAAALAYGLDKKQKDGIIAVYDLGGGTFDISVLEIENGVFEVRATNGNTHLGGEDFDNILVDHVLNQFKQQHGIDLQGNRFAVQRVKESAEKAKIELSHVPETEINLPFINDEKHINLKITEKELDNMSLDLINQTIGPVKKCLRDADLSTEDIDEIILVGGMTRMPKIRNIISEIFNKKPNSEVNPDEAVALGAAIQGAVLSGQIKNVVLLDVTPLTLGIETYGGIFSPLIPRNSAVPIKKKQMFSTAVDGQTGVEVRVFQGERSLVKDNKLIGNFKLSNIPPGPKGTAQIAVTFEIDADGIIKVSATDETKYPEDSEFYGKDNSVSIQVSAETGLSEEELNSIIQESDANKQKDMEMRAHVENATRADIICSDTDNALIQFGSWMDDDERKIIEKQIKDLKAKIDDVRVHRKLHDPNDINNAVQSMQETCMSAIKKVALRQQKEMKN